MTYVGEDAVALLADAALEAEGQVVAADHDTPAEAFLERLHVRLDAWEVQPLGIGRDAGEEGDKTATIDPVEKRGVKEGRGKVWINRNK